MDVLNSELEKLLAVDEAAIRHFRVPFELAMIYSIKGDKEKALHWIKKAIEVHFVIHRGFHNDPYFRNLGEDPEFEEIIQTAQPEISKIQRSIAAPPKPAPTDP